MYGYTGYLSCILLLKKLSKLDVMDDHEVKLVVQKLLNHIWHVGRTLSRQLKSNLLVMWAWHGKMYLVAAHGLCGIVTILPHFHDGIGCSGFGEDVERTIGELLSIHFEYGRC